MWKSLGSWHQTMLPFLWVFQQKIVLKHLSNSSIAMYDCFQNSCAERQARNLCWIRTLLRTHELNANHDWVPDWSSSFGALRNSLRNLNKIHLRASLAFTSKAARLRKRSRYRGWRGFSSKGQPSLAGCQTVRSQHYMELRARSKGRVRKTVYNLSNALRAWGHISFLSTFISALCESYWVFLEILGQIHTLSAYTAGLSEQRVLGKTLGWSYQIWRAGGRVLRGRTSESWRVTEKSKAVSQTTFLLRNRKGTCLLFR